MQGTLGGPWRQTKREDISLEKKKKKRKKKEKRVRERKREIKEALWF